ncbi:hypothetical protein H257_06381 [Aphanomyces astaci]|uniref:Tc1-like transposase DDE domain-containing protein n=1 Tax=Aphanomyces astaci TaxID=112090 RepID=W4GNK2_APHAT|nr:hypothetical protein H257_06381 [Aphanomyces astaci]ETV80936.1 hypothetical protein H257_06381 [Aphanomyces astaci]|eukprot:XP_009829883.1 hypothetical protein H257_06381 [Aphanomyces astaci]
MRWPSINKVNLLSTRLPSNPGGAKSSFIDTASATAFHTSMTDPRFAVIGSLALISRKIIMSSASEKPVVTGVDMTARERAFIDALRGEGLTVKAIAGRLGRSRGTSSSTLNQASKTGCSSRMLKAAIDLSVRTYQRILRKCQHLKYVKRKHFPCLLPRHKVARMEYATRNVLKPPKWSRIIWSDEKKFNLDGPDGFQYYWHDLRREKDTYFTRNSGGASVMGTPMPTKTHLGHQHYGPSFTFMQDGASIHTAASTKAFLAEQSVTLFNHPALSPDLNPIENVWGWLAREVYPNGKQYQSVSKLQSAISAAWDSIDRRYLKKLIKSMPKRCLQVVAAKGGKTKY